MAYWYIPHDEELLLDIDDLQRKVERFGIWGEMFRRRLRDAILANKLELQEIRLERSNSHNHFHVFIRLKHKLPLQQRLCWQMRLASDWKRCHADLMRAALGIQPASLLIRTAKVPSWREPDYVCPCANGKHVTLDQVALMAEGRGCPIWAELRGATPWELFGPPSGQQGELPVNLAVGRVPMEQILLVREPI